MIAIDLRGKRALVVGIAEDRGFGSPWPRGSPKRAPPSFVGTWPPAFNMFDGMLRRGRLDAARRLDNGELLEFERIYALDAGFDAMASGAASHTEILTVTPVAGISRSLAWLRSWFATWVKSRSLRRPLRCPMGQK